MSRGCDTAGRRPGGGRKRVGRAGGVRRGVGRCVAPSCRPRGSLLSCSVRVALSVRGGSCPGRGSGARTGRGALCRTSKFGVWFCTHTAHDGGPAGSDSLGGVISAIARGDLGVPAVRPVGTDDIRDRVAVAGLRGRHGSKRAPGARRTSPGPASQRAASHPSGVPDVAEKPPHTPPRGIASEQTGHPASYHRTTGSETVLSSTSRNGARQEPEDHADQAGRSQGRAARKGRPGS